MGEAKNKNTLTDNAEQWMKALILLKQNKLPESKHIFDAIANDDQHTYHNQAADLLRQLKK